MTELMGLRMLLGMKNQNDHRVTNQLSNVRDKIAKMANRITVSTEEGGNVHFDIERDWVEISDGVEAIESPLNEDTAECTVIHLSFTNDGYIESYTHNKIEEIFIVDGVLYDFINNKLLKKGTLHVYKPNEPHGFKSNHCKAIVVYRPEFPKVKVKDA